MHMPARCDICGKGPMSGNSVSITRAHVSGRHKRLQRPNLRRVKILKDGAPRHVHACTQCLRSGNLIRM